MAIHCLIILPVSYLSLLGLVSSTPVSTTVPEPSPLEVSILVTKIFTISITTTPLSHGSPVLIEPSSLCHGVLQSRRGTKHLGERAGISSKGRPLCPESYSTEGSSGRNNSRLKNPKQSPQQPCRPFN